MVKPEDILNARILIVDDQETNATSLQQLLREVGYTDVSFTTNPREVSELYAKNGYDLILLDVLMPGMNGFEVMQALHELEPDGYLPVIAVTAEPAHKVSALKAGAKDFISKPFDVEEALLRIHNMLEVRLLHEQARDAATTLEILAMRDPLTGLANRRLLNDRISAAISNAKRNKTAMAVVYMDLDGFKQVNDTLGHSAGDVLLKTVAERLVAVVRKEDTVSRVGGDEFSVALWQPTSDGDIAIIASKLINTVAQPYVIEGHTVTVTTSAGVAIYPFNGDDADSLMKSADAALYEAKHAGKNAYRISQRTDGPAAARG